MIQPDRSFFAVSAAIVAIVSDIHGTRETSNPQTIKPFQTLIKLSEYIVLGTDLVICFTERTPEACVMRLYQLPQ